MADCRRELRNPRGVVVSGSQYVGAGEKDGRKILRNRHMHSRDVLKVRQRRSCCSRREL